MCYQDILYICGLAVKDEHALVDAGDLDALSGERF
jgi:hypothetical protein